MGYWQGVKDEECSIIFGLNLVVAMRLVCDLRMCFSPISPSSGVTGRLGVGLEWEQRPSPSSGKAPGKSFPIE